MPSYDEIIRIERYPIYNAGIITEISFGCPCLGLMGYVNLDELLSDIGKELKKRWGMK